ncbi:ABC transporter permease [Pelagicoccus sp. NFK12]|uniref:ABC transporter permease n=1 Tax=Pelagicoccus enzymogenes TaxID=2773457 RepID=A0A927F5D5_9BACT|nr:ABC transporter permease [Pelagicoccus enzymogenes]MBD5778345.1 ABC transporter permease [Pelagicoccus enzymogenes]
MTNYLPANLRALAKRPAFAFAAIAIVAIGVALATTAVSIVDALVFRPIPAENVDRLYRVEGNIFNGVLPAPDARDIIERSGETAFSYSHRYSVEYSLEKNAGLIVLCELQGKAFETLEWQAHEGRLLQPDDYLPGSEPVAVLAYAFWQTDLAGRQDVVGETINLNGKPFRVVGILPPGKDRVHRTVKPQAFTALIHTFDDWVYDNRGYFLSTAIARLRPGATPIAFQTRLDQVTDYLNDRRPEGAGERSLKATPEIQAARASSTESLQQSYIIIGLVSALLLIACFNVGNMLLSNAYRRQREFAIRRSVGASPLQVMQQLLGESMAVSIIGGALGVGLSLWWIQLADQLPFVAYVEVEFNGIALAAALAATLFTGLASGLLPAWHLSRGATSSLLNQGGAKASQVNFSTKLLVVAQVSLSATLLSAAFLYTLSLQRSFAFDPGIEGERLAYFEVSLQSIPVGRRDQVAEDLRQRLANIPGVEAAGFSTSRPLGGYGTTHLTTDRFKPTEEEDNCAAGFMYVSEGFLDTLGVPIVSGRDVRRSEYTWPFEVAVVNESLEKRFYPGESAVGQTFKPWGGDEQPPVRIVGVFRDYPVQPWEPARPLFGLPQAQSRVRFHIRSEGDPRSISDALDAIARDPSNEFVAQDVQYFSDAIERSLRTERSAFIVLATLAVCALLLSSTGIWYTTRQYVRQSRKDLSIRMAIGASPNSLLMLTLARSLRLIGAGLVLGCLLSFAAARAIQSSLNGVEATELTPYLLMLACLLSVAVAATYMPARTALRADPKDALNEV